MCIIVIPLSTGLPIGQTTLKTYHVKICQKDARQLPPLVGLVEGGANGLATVTVMIITVLTTEIQGANGREEE